ncbi:MAG TPA: tetratricopeptide repeat protein [Polyangia bacterium]
MPASYRRRAAVAVAIVGVVGAGSARAEWPTAFVPSAAPERADGPEALPRPLDVEVERHAALGQRLLERGRAQDAIAEFRRAYELRADPRLLYDIADGYRQLGLLDQARFFYERYLAAAPDAPDREEVEAQVAALERPPARATPAPSLSRDVVILPTLETPESGRPLWRRWWAWTAFGALVAAGVATALLTRQNDTPVPATALGDKRFY